VRKGFQVVKTGAVNAAEIGRILGISRGTVSNLTTDGVLPRADRGQYDIAETVQAFIRHKLARVSTDDPAVASLTAERSRLARLKADQVEREAMVEAGALIPAAEIEAAWLTVVAAVRSRILAVPSKLAARIVTLKAPAEAQALMQKEIHAALSELSGGSV
jgi:phage terminase Nu1 subunit (DNA packaging protein)